MSGRTPRETAPGPPGGTRYMCPAPGCEWWLDAPPPDPNQWPADFRAPAGSSPAEVIQAGIMAAMVEHGRAVNAALQAHMADAHPGMTMDELQAHASAFRLEGLGDQEDR